MAGVIEERSPVRPRAGIARFWVAGTLLVTGLVALAVVLLVGPGAGRSGTSAHRILRATGGSSPSVSRPAAESQPTGPATAVGQRAAGGRRNVAQVADPLESKSFPAPASVHHKAAAT